MMMTRVALIDILDSYEGSDVSELFKWEYHISTFLYQRFKDTASCDMSDALMAFSELDNWQGMSQRCGVWQYYESRSFTSDIFDKVTVYLRSLGESELADIYASGIRDYADPKYTKDGEYNYPEEWFNEAETIDKLIDEKNDYICFLKRSIILDNREELFELVDDK